MSTSYMLVGGSHHGEVIAMAHAGQPVTLYPVQSVAGVGSFAIQSIIKREDPVVEQYSLSRFPSSIQAVRQGAANLEFMFLDTMDGAPYVELVRAAGDAFRLGKFQDTTSLGEFMLEMTWTQFLVLYRGEHGSNLDPAWVRDGEVRPRRGDSRSMSEDELVKLAFDLGWLTTPVYTVYQHSYFRSLLTTPLGLSFYQLAVRLSDPKNLFLMGKNNTY